MTASTTTTPKTRRAATKKATPASPAGKHELLDLPVSWLVPNLDNVRREVAAAAGGGDAVTGPPS